VAGACAPVRQCEWVVYAKRPFAGPQAVLAYLSRYTHRVAISNSRLLAMDAHGVTFKWKDYRVKDRAKGKTRHKTMTLEPGEFMRRFLLHVLPGGFHRIRHHGLLANGSRKASLALARELLCQPADAVGPAYAGDPAVQKPTFVCWHCGCAMLILQTFTRAHAIRAPPTEQAQ
jgi:Putative transposase